MRIQIVEDDRALREGIALRLRSRAWILCRVKVWRRLGWLLRQSFPD